ncbi:MAG: sodium:alanine symporter family protein [Clostridiales bacterium]|nr:sodium:alanine symporter family protein [Clostridiales bacterium]
MNPVEVITIINNKIHHIVWGPPILLLLIGTGAYFTFATNFFQIRNFRYIWKHTIASLFKKSNRQKHEGRISPFQAVSTALASTLGTGNIVGVTTAIVSGGEGAIFWMWVSAFFGMMTKYAEVVLAVRFRQTGKDGIYYGGPMYYIEKGLRQKWLAQVFAFFGAFACFGIGNMAQSNSISSALHNSFRIPPFVTGVLIALITSLVIIGGIKRISKVTELIVPFMAIFYLAGGIGALCLNAALLPDAFRSIFINAFSFRSVGGGFLGYGIIRSMRYGIARGIFSNEAGLGSAPIAHAASNVETPVKQGVWGIFEVFVDTILLCTITALVVITSGLAANAKGLNGAALTAKAFSQPLGHLGGLFITFAIVLFALATLLGWSYYGLQCLAYLTGNNETISFLYKILYILLIVVGSIGGVQLVWDISDTLNGLMAIPNLIALIGLNDVVLNQTIKEINRDVRSKQNTKC